MEDQVIIKRMSKTELARAYDININTLNVWITPHKDKIGPYLGKVYTPKQVEVIFQVLGQPHNEL